MSNFFSNIPMIVASLVLFLVATFAFGVYMKRRKTRTLAFRDRFGSEYDRAVETHGSPQKAEAKLAARETRVDALKIRELGATECERFVTEWHTVQSRFVDHPKAAVTEADDLVNSVLDARGYPHANFEQRAADVSVTYPRVMDNYRIANAIAVRTGGVEASTEELRTAMIKYRAIFDDLLQPLTTLAQKSVA
jgi:hypothetical protein